MGKHKVQQPDFVIANKIKLDRTAALEQLDGSSTILVARGKKLLRFDAQSADADEIAAVILGRSGTLRAPAMRVGDVFLVGYHQEAYEEVFA